MRPFIDGIQLNDCEYEDPRLEFIDGEQTFGGFQQSLGSRVSFLILVGTDAALVLILVAALLLAS